ncbi:MAG: NAD-dependent protein deacetylase 1 [Alphaproteobacteria bacterium]|nr:MAG: NAD-dependent protein deacetylase 1 [Alphaproteobacteria bacterium]
MPRVGVRPAAYRFCRRMPFTFAEGTLISRPMISRTTTPSDLSASVARLRDLVAEAASILPFTGAGISTECGIPDFRSPGGLWTKTQPIPFDAFMASARTRAESWRRRFAMQAHFGDARPGRGHRALASLYRAGKVPAVVTQNIDNLHQMSGIAVADVVELHGNTTYATCLACERRYELDWVKARFEESGEQAPECACGGYIKSATVSFGQAMPVAAMARAEELVDRCDLFVAIGSSLVVWPAAGFPLRAKKRGARLVIVNREATDFDEIADLVIRQDIGDALAPFIAD